MSPRRQAGFTLIELMVAATIALVLMLSIGSILTDTVRSGDAILSRIALNRHAREIFDVLALGGWRDGTNTTATAPAQQLNFNYVFGMRGRRVQGSDARRQPAACGTGGCADSSLMGFTNGVPQVRTYQFVLPADAAAKPTQPFAESVTVEDVIANTAITCTDVHVPLKGCAKGSVIAAADGYLRADPSIIPATATAGVAGAPTTPGLLQIAFQLIDTRRLSIAGVFLNDNVETYWTAFTTLVERDPY